MKRLAHPEHLPDLGIFQDKSVLNGQLFYSKEWVLDRTRIQKTAIVPGPGLVTVYTNLITLINSNVTRLFTEFETDKSIPVSTNAGLVMNYTKSTEDLVLIASGDYEASKDQLLGQITQQQFPNSTFDTDRLKMVILLVQQVLCFLDFLPVEYIDGLACNATMEALEQFNNQFGSFQSPSKTPWSDAAILTHVLSFHHAIKTKLKEQGYHSPRNTLKTDPNSFRKRLKHFQKANGLNVSMKLDRDTLATLFNSKNSKLFSFAVRDDLFDTNVLLDRVIQENAYMTPIKELKIQKTEAPSSFFTHVPKYLLNAAFEARNQKELLSDIVAVAKRYSFSKFLPDKENPQDLTELTEDEPTSMKEYSQTPSEFQVNLVLEEKPRCILMKSKSDTCLKPPELKRRASFNGFSTNKMPPKIAPKSLLFHYLSEFRHDEPKPISHNINQTNSNQAKRISHLDQIFKTTQAKILRLSVLVSEAFQESQKLIHAASLLTEELEELDISMAYLDQLNE